MTRKALTKIFNNKFGTQFSHAAIQAYCSRNGIRKENPTSFKKGFTPWNLGKKGVRLCNSEYFFKKGHNVNQRPLGATRVCKKDGYQKTKVGHPNKWVLTSHLLIKEKTGKMPQKNNIVRFKDGDNKNLTVDNVVEITRQENNTYNHMKYNDQSKDAQKTIRLVARLLYACNEREKGCLSSIIIK
jgi:hypothetical protein